MRKYNKVTDGIIAKLREICGAQNVWTEGGKIADCSHDETSVLTEARYSKPDVVVAPGCAKEVSQILKLANENVIPVTPRGGGTGLSGGSIPVCGGITICDDRLNKILEIDRQNLLAVVQPGVVTAHINAKANKYGLWYCGYPMSVDECHIGGNIAENAGGGMALKYGVTMRHVLGLEVVTATGEILQLGGKLMKNVTGFNLKELFIGSEGTLGFVTKIIVKLQPVPKYRKALLALFKNTDDAIAAVPQVITKVGVVPSATEFIDRYCYEASCNFLGAKLPIDGVGATLLIEFDGTDEALTLAIAEKAGSVCVDGGAMNIFVAENDEMRDKLWSVRSHIDEALRVTDPTHIDEDTVVPVSEIAAFCREIYAIGDKYGVKIVNFGHAGDGNLHPTIARKEGLADSEWEALAEKVVSDIFKLAKSFGGVLSGEHGVGLTRTAHYKELCEPDEYSLTLSIKKLLDPNGIMNPGKVFPIEDI